MAANNNSIRSSTTAVHSSNNQTAMPSRQKGECPMTNNNISSTSATTAVRSPRNRTSRILAQDALISNDTWETGINNNDLVIGPPGSGKTRGYVKPNLMQCNESVIITDTKGSLLSEVGPLMEKNGFKVINIDFTDMLSSYGYNPLDYIRYDKAREKYSEQDIVSIATSLVPIEDPRQAIWELHARQYLTTLIAYVMEAMPKEEHSLKSVMNLFAEMGTGNFDRFLEEWGEGNPDSFAWNRYQMIKDTKTAEKMHESIRAIIAQKLDTLTFDGPLQMYTRPDKVDFTALGREKTAVFLNVSDTDRSADRLVNLFYTQALQALCASADKDYPDHRLPVPVRFILDDFAANAEIPDFDKIISVIRSREIYVSVILQSLSQLNSIYGRDRAMTIVNNCDNCLYLGGQDVETAKYISFKANKTVDTILNLPLNDAYLFTRGARPRRVKKFDLSTHERYGQLPEAAWKDWENWEGWDDELAIDQFL